MLFPFVHNYRIAGTFAPLSWIQLLFYRTEATQGLQGRCRLRDCGLAAHSGIRPAHCAALSAGLELVVLVLEQDVERGEGSVTARVILLEVELVRIAQFAWHAVASAKEGRSRSPSARELADYSGS
jgi:hypothetical protein